MLLFAILYSCKEDEKLPPLAIHRVEPAAVRIGDTIQIIGQGFSPGYAYNHITFPGGIKTYGLVGSTTEKLLVEVPDGALSGPINVNILDVEIADTPPVKIQTPVISEVVPDEAWVGDTIIINGQYFHKNAQRNHVSIGPGENFYGIVILSATETQLKVIVPVTASDGAVSVLGFDGPTFRLKPTVIDLISPEHGVVGDTIEIDGKGMSATGVEFAPAVSGMLLTDLSNSRKLRVIVPPGAVDGIVKIANRITSGDVIFQTPQPFQVYPDIKDVGPLSGYEGTPVTITGFNFSATTADNVVSFNGTPATVTQASTRELVVTAPAGFSSGPLTVTINGRTATGPTFSIAEPGAPIVYSISPKSGAVGGRVLITGINFGTTQAANIVKFAGNVQAVVVSATASQIIAEVPANAQSGQITVTKEGKIGVGPVFTVTSVPAIPFIASVDPASAPRNATITIKGGNFSTPLTVATGGTYFSVTSVTADQIIAKVPDNIEFGDHQLQVVQGGKPSNSVPFEVSGIPAITSLSITEGTPGTMVTITGNQFNSTENKNTVRFGTQSAVWVNAGDNNLNTITVFVPDVPAGVYDVTVTAFGNTSNSVSFTVKPKRVAVRNIVYTTNEAVGLNRFSVVRRTYDPPSETVLFSRYSGPPMNVVTLDLAQRQVYFVEEDGANISRVNFDQSNFQVVYPYASPNYATVLDMSLDTDHQKIYFTDQQGYVYVGNFTGTQVPETLYEYAVDNIIPMGISYVAGNNSLYISDVFGNILQASVDGNQLTTLFDSGDGVSMPLDVKADFTAQKLFVLDGFSTIRVGNLDGTGSLAAFVTRSKEIIGIALDTQGQFLYWLEFINDSKTRASVFRMKYDQSVIPGTDPPATVEAVYTDIKAEAYLDGTNVLAGLALEDEGGRGGALRSTSSFQGVKMRRLTNELRGMKK